MILWWSGYCCLSTRCSVVIRILLSFETLICGDQHIYFFGHVFCGDQHIVIFWHVVLRWSGYCLSTRCSVVIRILSFDTWFCGDQHINFFWRVALWWSAYCCLWTRCSVVVSILLSLDSLFCSGQHIAVFGLVVLWWSAYCWSSRNNKSFLNNVATAAERRVQSQQCNHHHTPSIRKTLFEK